MREGQAVIYKPQSSKLARYARKHTSEAAVAKRREKRAAEEKERLRWMLIRVAVFERDGGRCRVCGRAVKLSTRILPAQAHVHHVNYKSAGGTDDMSNLVLLCLPCHDAEHRHVIDITGTADDLHIARDPIHG